MLGCDKPADVGDFPPRPHPDPSSRPMNEHQSPSFVIPQRSITPAASCLRMASMMARYANACCMAVSMAASKIVRPHSSRSSGLGVRLHENVRVTLSGFRISIRLAPGSTVHRLMRLRSPGRRPGTRQRPQLRGDATRQVSPRYSEAGTEPDSGFEHWSSLFSPLMSWFARIGPRFG